MSEPVVLLQGLRKSYNLGRPNETEVLHGIDLQVEAGEFVALVGPSGSGKSTLLNMLGLLDEPTAGELYIRGRQHGCSMTPGVPPCGGRRLVLCSSSII